MNPICELKEVTLAHDNIPVLKNINLSVSPGELVYIIGKTGTGKSTLLRALFADANILSGEINVCGYNLRSLKNKDIPLLRRKLGMVFQDFRLLTDRSVYENLSFVLKATGWNRKKEIDNRIQEVLEMVGLNFKGYKMPHELSGGEQQRVVIARALLNNPQMILADEPTGNLDPETSEGIMSLLWKLKESGNTIIVATHDYETLKKFNSRTIICVNNSLSEKRETVIDFIDLEKQIDTILKKQQQ
ncbi:MAG TPA: ATP-binding cassette domain-containing protein [Salinivirgaceae bacterium]|nr:ATP-binding cassette domain-containing protein [Salinivirgaceae bacterium]